MYGKVFTTMFDGSLHGHWQAIVTLQQMIALADSEGVVDMTPEALSARTSIPLEIIRVGLAELEQPDPASRTPTEEGRRIVRLDPSRDWGWLIVNYKKYRAIRSAEERREYMRQYQRNRRRPSREHVSTMSTGRKQVLAKSTNSSKQRERQKQKAKKTTSAPDGAARPQAEPDPSVGDDGQPSPARRGSGVPEGPEPASAPPGQPQSAPNGDTTTRPARENPRETWLTPYWDAWVARFGGKPPAGQLAKALKPLHDEYGLTQTVKHWGNYLASTAAPFVSPTRFAATFGEWAVPRANGRRDPLDAFPADARVYNDDGTPTAAGRALGL